MKFLYKAFIKNYEHIDDNNVREKYGLLSGIIGIISNFILVIIKLLIGILINSISLIGDAINNLGDTFSSIINVFSFKINNKPADKEHPYGHRRVEYIGSLLISVLIIVVAIELFISSINKIISPSNTQVTWYIFLVLLLNILIKTFIAVLYKNSSKAINSIALYASYKDSINDIITTFIIAIGLYSSSFWHIDLDGYLGILLSIFITISGIKLIKDASDKLIGESLENDKIKSISDKLMLNKNILGLHDILTHQYGVGKVFMSVHVEMDAGLSLLEAHEIIDLLERQVKDDYGVELLVHIDPIDLNDEELKKMKKMINNILNDIDTNLSSHDIRISYSNLRLYFDLVMPYTYQSRSKELVDIVINEIKMHCKYKVSIEINYK